MEANAANVKADYERARLQAEVDESLFKDGLIAAVVLKQSRVAAQTTAARWEIEQKRLDLSQRTRSAQIAPKKAELARLQAQAELARRDADALRVRAGVAGVLQVLPLEVGQQISPGTNLARIADPSKLKAEIRVPETLAKDILIGQAATVDVHDGLVAGRVARIDPAVRNGTVLVDIALSDKPPKGARPDLSVEGTIELERLQNVVYVGRPAYGQERSTLGVFKLDADDRVANRIPVKFGRCSVNTIEVVAGLQPGDRVILSELSTQENIDRIRIN
jgi:HlyD family secretion protein